LSAFATPASSNELTPMMQSIKILETRLIAFIAMPPWHEASRRHQPANAD
jgi:hypothetical protein